jgi:hypothetical protein
MNRKWKRWIVIAPLAILAIPVFIAIGGEIVLHLWNWLLPPLFGWHQVTFWQALGILALCRISSADLERTVPVVPVSAVAWKSAAST